MKTPTLLYTDKAGNKLYKKYIKTRNVWQYYAKNKKNQIVSTEGLKILLKRANINIKMPSKSGIQKAIMQ